MSSLDIGIVGTVAAAGLRTAATGVNDAIAERNTSRPPPSLFLKSRVRTEGFILIVAESFRARYAEVQPFLASLAEPISRPPLIHEYRLTPFSLGAAVSNGVSAGEAMQFLEDNTYELCSGGSPQLHAEVGDFIVSCMERYNLARVVVDQSRTVVQCKDIDMARLLLGDQVIRAAAVQPLAVVYEHVRWGGAGDSERMHPCFALQSRAMSKVVAARCVVLGLPIQQQYDYERDMGVRQANLTLRSQVRPRPYQVAAVEAATSEGVLNSGCLLLPCGAGKTLLGIMLMCKVRKPVLVVCAGSVSVEQWKSQILEYAALEPPTDISAPSAGTASAGAAAKSVRSGVARISCLTGKQKDPIDSDTDVVLTTYSMLVSAHRAHARRMVRKAQHPTADTATAAADAFTERGTRRKKADPKEQLFAPYGLLLLDEVHVMPAEAFQESLSYIDAKGVIGLTATYVREDRKILDLFHLVGPKLYDVSMETLATQGFLAKVNCVEVRTPMTREFGMEYLERSVQTARAQRAVGGAPALVMLAAANPNKMLCVLRLVAGHLDAGSKILVFCDHIMLLYEYGKLLSAPVISGKTQHKDRLMIFSDFQGTSKVNVICVSRVGDVSVNLPSANVVIQVSSHGGSRRQEAQRLGRILRPKDRAANGKMVEAWFYSIISTDTLEVAHAAHRTAFLVDQGYTCRLLEFSPEEDVGPRPAADATSEVTAMGRATTTHTATSGMKGEVNAASGPVGNAQPKNEALVGDITTIKQEHLRSGSTVCIAGRHLATAAGEATMRSLPYQLQLLSKVVSSWEIEFQQESRKRRRGRGAEGDNEDNSDQDSARVGPCVDDDVVEVEDARPARSFQAIKQEWDGQLRRPQPPPLGPSFREGVQTATTMNINELVGVDDGLIYHEM